MVGMSESKLSTVEWTSNFIMVTTLGHGYYLVKESYPSKGHDWRIITLRCGYNIIEEYQSFKKI